MLPDWFQSPWDLSLRPVRLGIRYTPEIFGIQFIPGQAVSPLEWQQFLLAMHRVYSKLYALIAMHPEWKGPQGVNAVAEATIGDPQFVRDTNVVTPAALILTLHPFLDPMYSVESDGTIQFRSRPEQEALLSEQFPDLAAEMIAYQDTPVQDIPLDSVLPGLEKKTLELSEVLALDAEQALRGVSLPESAPLPPDVAAAPAHVKHKTFLQRYGIWLALGAGIYFMRNKG